jgi:hypothetical protein
LYECRHLITSQDEFDKINPNATALVRHNFHYPEATIKNVLRSQNSLSLVWAIMTDYAHEHELAYDAVIMARPDVLFTKDIDIMERTLKPNTAYVPEFQSFGGINDR